MTITETDRVEINDAFSRLGVTKDWRDQTPPPVEAGSSLSSDNLKTNPHQVGHQVITSVGVAVDHLHCLRMAMRAEEPNTLALHVYSPFSLVRGAVENASTAIWLLEPSGRKERVRRRLRYEMASVKNAESMLEAMDLPEPGGIQRRRARVLQLAQKAEIEERDLKQKPGFSEIVKRAGEVCGMDRDGENLALLMWKVCSAIAHGDTWVVPLFELQLLGPLEPGVSSYNVTADARMLRAGVQAAVMLVSHARSLYVQRAKSHL